MVIGLLVGALATVIGCGIGCNTAIKQADKKAKERKEAEKRAAQSQRDALAARDRKIQQQQALIARQDREKQQLASSLARAVSNHSTNVRTNTQQAKISFFDSYRAFDTYVARLAGQGSGGVTFLIRSMQRNTTDKKMLSLVSTLKQMRNYRNILSHNRNKWRDLPDPQFAFTSTIDRAKSIIESEKKHYAKMLRRAAH